MQYKIINISTKQIVASFDDVNPYGGPWACTDGSHVALPVPAGADLNGVAVQINEQGNLTLVAAPAVLLAYEQQQNKAALDAYTASRNAQCETAIQTELKTQTNQVADYTTHLMVISHAHDIIVNQSMYTADDLVQAQNTLVAYRPVFTQIQALRSQRDADIAAFVPPFPNASPLYPSS